jgi:tetratricopeptide (TPR) repeat protein
MLQSHARWILVAVILLAATAAAFAPILGNGFTSYDDNHYVTANPHVQGGLSAAGWRWAFSTTDAANWHPLTWLSHMVDCGLFGLDPRGHHAVSLVLHLANALLLLQLLTRMTGETGKSAAVAALFALHPLHVESVAWVAERKDVLSAFLFLLTLAAYRRYAGRPSPARYAVVVVAFAAGLLAKPMLVTTPFVLLLLDLWPLERKETPGRLVAEKAPLLLLSAASAAVTVVAQRAGGALATVQQYPLGARVANALLSYIVYIRKTVWPFDLAAYYPYPGTGLSWKAALAATVLVVVTIAVARGRRRPYLLVGWLWYVGMLVPVIGLVQVGEQSLADRYTYLPLIGIFLMAAWGVPDALAGLRMRGSGLLRAGRAALLALLVVLAVTTWRQARVWRDSVTLFEHVLAVTGESASAHVNLAIALEERGDFPGAERHDRRALELRPDDSVAHNNLGKILAQQGKTAEAATHYLAALRRDPGSADAHNNLGVALARDGKLEEAMPHFDAAVRGKPEDPRYQFNWGTALVAQRSWSEAIRHFREAIRIQPDYAAAHFNLSAALYYAGDLEGARTEAEIAHRYGYDPPADFLEMLPK